MKRVLVIINSLTGGGAERVATNLATCLSETEEVILAVEHIDGNNYGSTVKTIDLHMPLDKGKTKVLWHLSLARKLKRLKKEFKITHSISFLPEPSLANVLSKTNEKVIVSERNYLSAKKSKLLHLKESWLMKNSDMVVALSEMVRTDIVSNFGVKKEKTITIYNPCYADTIETKIAEGMELESEQQFFKDNKGKIVVTAGRLVDQKGHWHLIRAFSNVVKELPDAKLVILGKGDNESYLQSLIKDYRLEDNVKMLGYKGNPYPYLAASDLFVFPSLFEGLGNIIVECMACKVPVVSTDCKYGPKELLDPKSDSSQRVEDVLFGEFGILVPNFDGKKNSAKEELSLSENKLASVIVSLLRDDELRNHYKEKIVQRGKDFTPENITKQWIDIL